MESISVIVPVYNTETYLKDCVDSLLAQTHRALEIILVDDGSTDASGSICDGYLEADARVRVIHKENGGLVSARKAGLLEARGSIVTYADSDDFLDADTLEKAYERMISEQADILLLGYLRDDGVTQTAKSNRIENGVYEGEALRKLRRHMLSFHGYGERYFAFGSEPAVWAKLFRRELLLPVQMAVPEDITIGEDVAVTFPFLLHCKKAVADNDVHGYHYRMSEGSMTRALRDDYFFRISALYAYLRDVFSADEEANLKEQLEDYRIYLVRTQLDRLRFTSGLSRGEQMAYLEKAAKNQPVLAGLEAETKIRLGRTHAKRMRMVTEGNWKGLYRSYDMEKIKTGIARLTGRK